MIGKLFGNQQSRHQALRNLVDQFESQFIGWSGDDDRWKILCQLIGFENQNVTITRPSQLIPYVKFSIPSLFTSSIYFYDPITDEIREKPKVFPEHIVTAERVAECVRKTAIEFSVRKQINEILAKYKETSKTQMEADFSAYMSVVESNQQLSIQRQRTYVIFDNWKLAVENVKSKINEASLLESKLQYLAENVSKIQDQRDSAFTEYIQIPSYPSRIDTTKSMEAYFDSQKQTKIALDDTLSLAFKLEDKRNELNQSFFHEKSLRGELMHMVEMIQNQLVITQSAIQKLKKSINFLKDDALVIEVRSKLDAQAIKLKIDPQRVLATADKECGWIGGHLNSSKQKHEAICQFEKAISMVKQEIADASIEIENSKQMVKAVLLSENLL